MLRCLRCPRHARAIATARLPRLFHSFAPRQSGHETIHVPSSSNGHVTIEVYHPEEPSSQTGSPAVAIYIPRGPVLRNEAHDALNIATLQDELSCHIVNINYRCSELHQFPTPIHDVSVGYDWVIDNLLPKRAITRPGRSEHVGRLAVCGELLGGTIATSLSLTECRIGEPGIVAAAISNPIVDWTSLDDYDGMPLTQQQMAAASTGMTLDGLVQHRDLLFRRPAHYFDSFASPILFFRSAGLEVPSHVEQAPLDEMDELIRFEREEFLREQLALGAQPDIFEPEQRPAAKKRKASRRFPSKALGLRLPYFRIESGSNAVVSGQAIELAHQLRQSHDRPGPSRGRSISFEEDLPVDFPGDAVRHVWSDGLGLWDDTKLGRARMNKTATWLRQKLAI